MSNTENLKNDFVKTFKEGVRNFVNWANACEEILKVTESFNKATNGIDELNDKLSESKKEEIKGLTTFEFDLAKEGIDVSKWEEPVKPVKAIVSAMIKCDEGNTNFSIEVGNMVMLMEDGTFRTNCDSNYSKEFDSALTDLKKVSEECVKEYESTINS